MQTQTYIQNAKLGQKVVFMPSIHNETVELLREAQDYFTDFGEIDQEHLESNIRNIYTCEMSRITLRLSCIMAWLLEQRSMANGETRKIIYEHNNLDFQDICMVDTSMLHGILPSYICYLLDESLELYERVLRLNQKAKVIH